MVIVVCYYLGCLYKNTFFKDGQKRLKNILIEILTQMQSQNLILISIQIVIRVVLVFVLRFLKILIKRWKLLRPIKSDEYSLTSIMQRISLYVGGTKLKVIFCITILGWLYLRYSLAKSDNPQLNLSYSVFHLLRQAKFR